MPVFLRISFVAVGLALVAGCAQSTASSVALDPGESATIALFTHCGYENLGDINGLTWVTNELAADEAGNPIEDAWPNGFEETEFELFLVDETTLEVTAKGTGVTHTYQPDPNPPGCG